MFIFTCTKKLPPARLLIFQKISPLHVYSGLFCPARLMFFKKIFPLHVYSGLFFPARLMFSKNFSTCTFIWSCTSIWYTRVMRRTLKWLSDIRSETAKKCLFCVFRPFLSLCRTASRPYGLSQINALRIIQSH